MSKPRTNITIARPANDSPFAHGTFRGTVALRLARYSTNGVKRPEGFLRNPANDNSLGEEFAKKTAHTTFAETLEIAAQYVTIK